MFLNHPLHRNALGKIIIDWGKIRRQLGKIVFLVLLYIILQHIMKNIVYCKTSCIGVGLTIYAFS